MKGSRWFIVFIVAFLFIMFAIEYHLPKNFVWKPTFGHLSLIHIWYKVWKEIGLHDKEILSYFTGPVYLPWHRMANIDSWNGPLPIEWLELSLIHI